MRSMPRVVLFLLASALGAQILPTLSYSTYLGGTERHKSDEPVAGIAADAAGNVYVTGTTSSADFPVTPGAFQPVFGGGQCSVGSSFGMPILWPCTDVYLAKFDPSGKLLFSTYLGGNDNDRPIAVAIGPGGQIYVIGFAGRNFPLGGDAVSAERSLFIAEFDATGKLARTTLVPAAIGALAGVDTAGNLYVAETDYSLTRPGGDVRVAKFDPASGRALYTVYLGGSSTDTVSGFALDTAGNVYVTGTTFSTDFPTTPGAFQRNSSALVTAYAAKIGPGGDLVYSTYLGGPHTQGVAIAVDRDGNAYVAGTFSFPPESAVEFPATPGAVQTVAAASPEAFVMKLNPSGSAVAYSTLLGGNGADESRAIAVNGAGEAYVAIATRSTDLPRIGCSYPYLGPGGADSTVYLAKLDATASTLLYASYLAAWPSQEPVSLAVDPSGNPWIAGTTATTVMTTPNALEDASRVAGSVGFLAKFDLPAPPRLAAAGVVNGASFLNKPLAPGEMVTVFGCAIGPETPAGAQLGASGKLATSLAGVRALFNGIAAPLLYVSSTQVNAIVPYGISGSRDIDVQVEYQGAATSRFSVAAAATSPGVFALGRGGQGQAAILNQDGTPNSPSNPAAKGSVVMVFATGMGQTDPPGEDGALVADRLPVPLSPVAAWIVPPHQAPDVTYVGGAPGLLWGVLQVNVRVPETAPAGPAIPIVLTMGNAASQDGVTMAIR